MAYPILNKKRFLYSLERYYEVYENETWRFTELKTENLAERITPNNLRLCQILLVKLLTAEKDLGTKLPEERAQLRKFLSFIIKACELRIKLLSSGKELKSFGLEE